MKIQSFVFGPFATNCYVVSWGSEAWIIDPACSCVAEQRALLRYIEAERLEVKAIMATHGHLDHLWGAAWASEQWGLAVSIPEADIPLVEAMQEQYELFGIRSQPSAFSIQRLEDVALQNASLQILETPGHTPGSVCLYWPEEGILFSGDTLFHLGYGRTDLPGGNTAELIASLEYLFSLPSVTRVFPGHGESTTIGAERR